MLVPGGQGSRVGAGSVPRPDAFLVLPAPASDQMMLVPGAQKSKTVVLDELLALELPCEISALPAPAS